MFSKESDEKESGEDSSDESDEDENKPECARKGKKYNSEIKKRREEERNELFGFLEGNTSSEDEVDITKDDLDVLEDQYASSSNESMSLKAFSNKMNAKWKELEKQQEEMNLQMLLASDSQEGSDGGDDLVLESDNEKKRKKDQNKKLKEEKTEEVENPSENPEEATVEVKEEKCIEEADKIEDVKVEPDDEYEQFCEDMIKNRTTFKGLGSSSEENDPDSEIDIKEEPLSNEDLKIKKEKNSDIDSHPSNSSSSADLFMDKKAISGKKKSMKMKSWRSHRLLRIKLSDTDTSDEERWWKRRLEKEQKKKEDQGDRPKKPRIQKETPDNGSDKENKKKEKKEKQQSEKDDGSSTMELSSTESSGSSIFRKKKKKKGKSSDSDIISLTDDDKKKKKKRKRYGAGSSDESGDSGDDIMDISQKSTHGESPGKGGRKNIRKVLTKHELAAATKAAAKEEEERKKRIAARQKMFNEMFELKEAEILEKLVLDFDPETKTELISVDKDLVIKMKPHQAKGVKFMWDSCFESLSQLKTKKGSGCILAHCMGLGKTFQVISLVHTILKHPDIHVKTVLVVCPLSTVLNWAGEFRKWLDDVAGGKSIKTYHLTTLKKPHERVMKLNEWQRNGGVMILGYEMFRNLTNHISKKFRLAHREAFQKTLVDPGADLVVCDEGHMLKNESTVLSKAMSRIKSLRRIVLTGTPMQNNLKEYHCMVQFVKPNLLGTRKEFLNQFVNPITNGQFVDSTENDVKVMKRRAHVLHKMLEGLVQRFDYRVLTPFLPPKHEYVVSLRLTDVQVRMYQFYLDNFSQKSRNTRLGSQLFADWQALGRIWTHPLVLKMSTDKAEKEREKQRLEESEEEESDGNKSNGNKSSLCLSSSHSSSSDESDGNGKKIKKPKENPTETTVQNNKPVVPDVIEAEINLISSDEEVVIKEDNKEVNCQDEKEAEENGKNKIDSSDVEDQTEDEKIDDNMDIDEGQDDVTAVEEKESEENDQNKEEQEKENNEEEEKQNNEEEDKPNNEEEENPNNEEEENQNKKQEENLNKEKEDELQKGKDEEIQSKGKEEEKVGEKTKKSGGKEMDSRGGWWKSMVEPKHLEDINQSAKLILLFAILRESELIEDKVLVFSQSLFSLDLIEYFLQKIDKATEENRLDESLGNQAGCWTRGLDYFRLDGSSSSENRSAWCKSFNRDDNSRARLFLISTRAGGLGINLTAANRVVIFDASWNPSHDVQSIFRVYRFGQKKPCYVYRFITHGTMEEKVYERQVAKQSLSSRVVDEQQVHRHFSMNDLNELYNFTPPTNEEQPTPALPKDRLMAELLTQHNNLIEKYHEHDSLLENVVEEELNEEERKLAWEDFENDKKRGVLPTPAAAGTFQGLDIAKQRELFHNSLRLKYPKASEEEMASMLSTLMYQVNYMAMQNAQQFAAPQQQSQSVQPQAQQGTSTGLTGMSQMNRAQLPKSNMTPQQVFNLQRNRLYEKYGQHATEGGQMIGNAQIKRNQSAANVQAKMDPMRIQQEANWARVQNQRRFQQQSLMQSSQKLSNVYSQQVTMRQQQQQQPISNRQQQQPISNRQQQQPINNRQQHQPIINRQQQQQPMRNRQQQQQSMLNRQQQQRPFIHNRQQQPIQNRQQQQPIQNRQQQPIQNRQQQPIQNRQQQQPIQNRQQQQRTIINRQPQRPVQNRQQPIQNRQPAQNGQPQVVGNQQISRSWKPLQQQRQQSTNHLQAGNQPTPVGLIRNRQLQITPIDKPIQAVQKTEQQLRQEQMHQRITALKQQKQVTLQQRQQQKPYQPVDSNTAVQNRKLEEMKNRYKASRKGMTTSVSVVEIDDEPSRPSRSSQ